MSIPLRFAFVFLCFIVAVPGKRATAQQRRGQLVESLFRTLAEAQLEREQQKRLEAAAQAKLQAELAERPQPKDPYEVKLPSGFGAPAANRPSVTVSPPTGRINVRSREAADYAQNLVRFDQQIGPLIAELRTAAGNHPQLRGLMPEAYAVAAQTKAILQSCDGISSLAPIVDPYRELDARWRQLSFNLQAVPGLSNKCTSAISQCDDLCAAMCKQLNIEPQFDRQALRDLMITASVYMQALADDLQIAIPSETHCRKLTHDLRILRQRLIAEAGRVERTGYSDMVNNFGDFVGQWRAFANEVYAINNRHLHRRLDRIAECGEQTYHLLWLQPPMTAQDLVATADRLEHNLEAILGQLNLRAMVKLQPQDQIRFLQSSRELYDQSVQLHTMCERNAGRDQVRDLFVKIDRGWGSLTETLPQISSLNRGTIAEIDRACEQLRAGFGIENTHAPDGSIGRLVQAAAALEGTAEFLEEQIKRYQKNLKPDSYRDSVRDAARELHHHSKELHESLDRRSRVDDQRYLSRLQNDAEHAVEAWNQLAKDFDHLETHGMSPAQAQRLRGAQRQAVPAMAKIAAALLQ